MSNTRQGSCIPSAYEELTTRFKKMHDIVVVVHGWVYNTNDVNDPTRRLIKHAWIEFINEPALANTMFDPVLEEYRDKDIAQKELKYEAVKKYNFNQLEAFSWNTNSKGGVFEF